MSILWDDLIGCTVIAITGIFNIYYHHTQSWCVFYVKITSSTEIRFWSCLLLHFRSTDFRPVPQMTWVWSFKGYSLHWSEVSIVAPSSNTTSTGRKFLTFLDVFCTIPDDHVPAYVDKLASFLVKLPSTLMLQILTLLTSIAGRHSNDTLYVVSTCNFRVLFFLKRSPSIL